MADALDSGSSGVTRGGSNPLSRKPRRFPSFCLISVKVFTGNSPSARFRLGGHCVKK